MNNFDQFETLTDTEVVNTNGGGLLDYLSPFLIVNDPLGLVGGVVDPLIAGVGGAVRSITGGVHTILHNLLGILRL
jgi:hypothetical protein